MDIDIDFQTKFDPLNYFDTAIRSSMVKDGKLIKHPAGIYLQHIAIDPITSLAAIPYKDAEQLGYFKIDCLHLSLLDHFASKQEIQRLIATEPDWELLESAVVVQKLFQLHQHYDIVDIIKPRSVQELADMLALIRPSKRHLMDDYIKDRKTTRIKLYKKPTNGKYYFKKGHAIAYSLNIVLQLHLIKGGII